MHFHLPKPLHGWRQFAGEVGIIVLGVLIALGAEQVVETLHWRHEVSLFRSSVDHEIANNLSGTNQFSNVQNNQCVETTSKRFPGAGEAVREYCIRKGRTLRLVELAGEMLALAAFEIETPQCHGFRLQPTSLSTISRLFRRLSCPMQPACLPRNRAETRASEPHV